MRFALFPQGSSISIHAAREGGDVLLPVMIGFGLIFQSTPPVKAATAGTYYCGVTDSISIHAAREGGDQTKPKGNGN